MKKGNLKTLDSIGNATALQPWKQSNDVSPNNHSMMKESTPKGVVDTFLIQSNPGVLPPINKDLSAVDWPRSTTLPADNPTLRMSHSDMLGKANTIR